jgi:CYTH domain-containing protein
MVAHMNESPDIAYFTPRGLLQKLGFSTENYDGKLQQELEFTIYAKVSNLRQIETLAVRQERHEQWDLPIDKPTALDGRVRLRKIDDQQTTMTTKIRRKGNVAFEEVNLDISEAAFNHLREFCKRGFNKTRYDIPIPNTSLKWEVDVFFAQSGVPHNWVKIDLEVDDLNVRIPDLPFEVEDCFFADEPNLPADKRQLLDDLWNVEWVPIAPLHE